MDQCLWEVMLYITLFKIPHVMRGQLDVGGSRCVPFGSAEYRGGGGRSGRLLQGGQGNPVLHSLPFSLTPCRFPSKF